MNFWIDVTNTCKSALNTGVPRTVRGIYQILKKHGTVTPIRWDHKIRQYCLLTSSEQRALDGDLSAKPSKIFRPFTRIFKKVDLLKNIKPDDFFIQVEIFQDHRNEWFQNHSTRFKSLAIFHDAIAWSHPHLTAPQRQPRFDDYMASLHLFSHRIAISHASAEALQSLWSKRNLSIEKPIAVIPWPTEFPKVERSRSPLAALPEILTISTLEQRKNHLPLFAACEILWNKGLSFKLRVLGKKCPHWGDKVTDEVIRLQKLNRAISWENQVTDEELHAAYRHCSFTVYPSIVEGFGLPIVESLWHHRPCICSNTGAIAETAKQGGCLSLDIHSADAIAHAIQSLLTDPSLYLKLQRESDSISWCSWHDYGINLLKVIRP